MPETADENRPATSKQPEHINHSGIIGNAIPGSAKSAETVRSWQAVDIGRKLSQFPDNSNFLYSRFSNHGETEKEVHYACVHARLRSGSARNQRKRPDDHGKRPDRNSFQILATIQIFCGRGFANHYFAETDSLYVPCPDCPVLYPNIYLRNPSEIIPTHPTYFQRIQRVEHIGAGSSNALNALNARLKPPIPRLNAIFCRKTANSQH